MITTIPRIAAFLSLVIIVWPIYDVVGQDYGALPPDAGGSPPDAVISDELTAEERTQIKREIEANRRLLIERGQLPSASKTAVVSFDWPLRAGAGLSDPGYHTSGAYVDQDRSGGSKLDYNCGQHTYDNHRGVDYGSWPFWWYKMDHDQVEIVAAAAGTIVSRTDGNFDRSCSSGGAWNAVYVEHADGSVAWYGHLKNGSVTPKSVGESVAQGEYLGVMGSSGNSTGPHLHFEVYDAAGSLIDPYGGACNSMNATSWWADQPPYRDPAINALYTHGTLPVFPDCPQQETPNLKDTFLEGETFYSAAYFRNIQPGMQTEYEIRTPSGTTWSSWSHTYNGSNECQVCSWVWGWTLPSEAPTGTWTFEADFNGETYSHPFEVTTPPPFEGGLLASAGPLDGKATCGGGGSYEVNVIDGVITRVGDTGYKHVAVGSSCWRFPDQYTRVYVTANDPAPFDHWESPSGHIGFINGHNGTTTTTVETSFNTNSTSPTFQAIHTGGSPTPDLLTVDETTGLGSVVGALSGGTPPAYPALAVHPTTGLVYAGGGGGSPTLYQVDATTGSLASVGTAGGSITRYGGMDFRSDGTLFASANVSGLGGQGANHLATVNLTTGTATVVGPFGSCGGSCSLEGMEGLAFDDSGTLYGTLHYRGAAGTPGLYTINTSTGAATFVSSILSSGSPPSGGITGLQFADGTLYGGTALAVTPATDGGRLVQINKSTGAFSFVGGVSATGGRGLNGLALGLPPASGLDITVEFAVDMSIEISTGNFNPATDLVVVAGTINGWSTTSDTLNPGTNPEVYEKTFNIDGVDTLYHIEYKYVTGTSGAAPSGWESIDNRHLTVTGSEPVDPATGRLIISQTDIPTFNNHTIEDFFANDMVIVFEVDMRPAYYHLADSGRMPLDIQSGQPTTFANGVWANGPLSNAPGGWATWGPGNLDQIDSLRLHDDGATEGDLVAGDSVFSFTMEFSSGDRRSGDIKFGTDGYDNESIFEGNHDLILPDLAAKTLGTARVSLIFGAMEQGDGTIANALYGPYICLSADSTSAGVVRRGGESPCAPDGILASVKVFLEGAYAGAGRMAVGATFEASQPLAQPYSDPAFNGTLLDHDSTMVVTALPDTTVDWVLVSLRTGTGAATEVPDSERPALVLTDGMVVDTNGTTLRFFGVTAGSYRLVLRQRNHLSVMSSDTLDLSDGFGSWDFTTAMTQAYTTGPAPMKDLADGKFGMFTADASVDGQITASDFNAWLVDTKSVSTGYHQTDFNFDGQVTAADFNLWLVNTKAISESQVPDP